MSKPHHYYTDEEREFLRENISNNSFKVLTEKFNLRFGTDVAVSSISDLCTKRLKIYRGKNTGHFSVGQARTSIDVGKTVLRNGYLHIKTDSVRHSGKVSYSDMKENWMPYQKYVYEQRYGKIPDGYRVVFLDGDKNNFDLENLYCISTRVNCVMNKNRWFSSDRDLTLAAIKWCELFYSIKTGSGKKEA